MMAKGRSKKLAIQLRQNNMTVWNDYKQGRAIKIELDSIGLAGLWVKAIPNSAYESPVINKIDKIEDGEKKGDEFFKLWIIEWNLPDNNTPSNILPLPSQSDAYAAVLPLEVTVFIAKKINEIDTERLGIPLPNASPSLPPSVATAPAPTG
jgi:hypothetical protein